MTPERHLDLPSLEWHNHWLTSAEYARVVKRSPDVVWRWCRDGVLRDFHIPYFRDRSGRWWIKNIP